MIKLSVIQTPSCVFVSDCHSIDNPYSSIGTFLFDGKSPEKTYKHGWVKLQKIPKHITQLVVPGPINARFELIDPDLMSEKIPLIIGVEDFQTINDDGEEEINPKYKHLKSLYTLKADPQLPYEKDVEFQIVEKIILDEEVNFCGIRIPAFSRGLNYKGEFYYVSESDLKFSLLDQIVIPDFLLVTRPCEISSKQSYDIVRQFIKTHIDMSCAEITSDYDFCFSVQKKIELYTPEKYQIDVSKTKRPRYETRYRTHRLVPIFEMTFSPENYKGYTPIKPFKGRDVEDLKKNIDTFCDDLIKVINEPFKDCPHCNGYGVILKGYQNDKQVR